LDCCRILTVYNSLRVGLKDLVNELITECATNVGSGPQESDRLSAGEDSGCARSDTRSSGNDHDAVEQSGNAHHTVSRDTTLPDLGGWLGDHPARPVTGTGDHK
jgi:hypothetical protein